MIIPRWYELAKNYSHTDFFMSPPASELALLALREQAECEGVVVPEALFGMWRLCDGFQPDGIIWTSGLDGVVENTIDMRVQMEHEQDVSHLTYFGGMDSVDQYVFDASDGFWKIIPFLDDFECSRDFENLDDLLLDVVEQAIISFEGLNNVQSVPRFSPSFPPWYVLVRSRPDVFDSAVLGKPASLEVLERTRLDAAVNDVFVPDALYEFWRLCNGFSANGHGRVWPCEGVWDGLVAMTLEYRGDDDLMLTYFGNMDSVDLYVYDRSDGSWCMANMMSPSESNESFASLDEMLFSLAMRAVEIHDASNDADGNSA